jgi:hypothetical protein
MFLAIAYNDDFFCIFSDLISNSLRGLASSNGNYSTRINKKFFFEKYAMIFTKQINNLFNSLI